MATPALRQAQEGAFGHPGQQIDHEVGSTTLPTGVGKHRGDGLLQTLMGIGGHQFHPTEAPGVQRPQEGQPESAVLAGPHVRAQHLTLTLGVHPSGHHHADIHDTASLPDLLGQRIQPHVGVGSTVQWLAQEGLHHLVQFLTDARYLTPFGRLRTGLEMPSPPRDLNRSSTRRVETPSTPVLSLPKGRPAGSRPAGFSRCVAWVPIGWGNSSPL